LIEYGVEKKALTANLGETDVENLLEDLVKQAVKVNSSV